MPGLVKNDEVEQTLNQLALTFTVRDIMTPVGASLISAANREEAQSRYAKYAFDVIPDSSPPLFSAYYYKGLEHRQITPRDLISENTSLLDLVKLFKQQEFFFVLRSNEISGYIHFSDLNKPLVKLPFYVMLEATERHLAERLKGNKIDDEGLLTAIGIKYEARARYLRNALEKSRLARTDLDVFSRLFFREVLASAVHYSVANVAEGQQLSDDQLIALNNLRNDVFHSGHEFVSSHNDVGRLIEARRLCDCLRSLN